MVTLLGAVFCNASKPAADLRIKTLQLQGQGTAWSWTSNKSGNIAAHRANEKGGNEDVESTPNQVEQSALNEQTQELVYGGTMPDIITYCIERCFRPRLYDVVR